MQDALTADSLEVQSGLAALVAREAYLASS
jgi:hypothetical protein